MSTPHVMSKTANLSQTVDAGIGKNIKTSNVDTHNAPEWFTKDYLENCLKTHHNDKHLKIHKFHSSSALGKGENYGGVLTRVRAEYTAGHGKLKTGHFIVKTSFEADEFSRKTMEPYDIFNREMSIYENVLPKLNALLAEINDTEQIFAETLAVDYERSALIFEDLKVRDFTMPNRLEGLDMKLTKIVLRKLAKMHATSAVLNERECGSLETFDRGMFNRYTENYAPAFVGMLEAGSELVSQWGEKFEEYARKLVALKPMYMEYGKQVFDPIKGHVNVLAHGDLWTNNIMVKYDQTTGAPLDVIIIDFQYTAWGSPAIDLFYLFNTSLKEQMHVSGQDELIAYYYRYLVDTLWKLSYKANIPSLHRFHLQLEEKAFYTFSSTFVVMPIQRNEFNEDADFKALMEENERAKLFKKTCFKNAYCQRIIRQMLPLFERRGLLDLEQ